MKETRFCSHHQHTLPSDFNLSPSVFSSHHRHAASSTSSPSPLFPSSPLSSYVSQRRRYKGPAQQEGERTPTSRPRVSLTTLSPPDATLGAVGGNFNSTTRIKLVPLPTPFMQQPQTGYRSVRSVCLHANRYLPSTDNQSRGTTSRSYLNLPSIGVNRPRRRLVGQEAALEHVREFKSRSGVLPHRVEKPFFMSGHRARMSTAGEDEESLARLSENRVRFAKNSNLFYGRRLTCDSSSETRKMGKAPRMFEVKLNTGLEIERQGEEDEEIKKDGGATCSKETNECNESISLDGKKKLAFLTQTRTSNDS